MFRERDLEERAVLARAGGMLTRDAQVFDNGAPSSAVASTTRRADHVQIAEHLPQLVWTCTPEGTCDFLNARWVEYTGIAEAEQLGYGWLEQVHPEDRERLTAAWTRSVESGAPLRVEFRVRRHDGVYRWFDTRALPLVDETGRVVKWFGSNTDMQEELDLRQRLAEESLKLEHALRWTPGLLCSFTLEPDGSPRFPFASAQIEDVYGLTAEQVRTNALPLFERLHPDDVAPMQESIDQSHRSLEDWHCEYRYLHPTKGERWLEGRSRPVTQPDGTVVWHGFVQDITGRKRTDALLRAQHEATRYLLESKDPAFACRHVLRLISTVDGWDFVALWQGAGDVVRSLAFFPESHGGALGELCTWTKTLELAHGAADRSWTDCRSWRGSLWAQGRRGEAADRAGLQNGILLPILQPGGAWAVIELLGKSSNVDERKQTELARNLAGPLSLYLQRIATERALLDSERRLHAVAGHMSEALIILEPDVPRAYFNRAAQRITYSGEEGKRVLEALPDLAVIEGWKGGTSALVDGFEAFDLQGNPLPFEERPMPRVARGETVRGQELRIRAPHGEERVMRFSGATVVQEHGTVAFLTFSDETERVQALETIETMNRELEQRVAERTRELERSNQELESFTYSVSHDMRAPVRAMASFASMFLEDHGEALSSDARRKIDVIKASADRLGSLIDDLLSLSRINRRNIQPEEVDMQQLLKDALVDASHQGVELSIGSLAPCLGDPGLLRQVWVNLLSNAFKYSRNAQPPRVQIGCALVDGQTHYFVRDNGVGFDMRYAHKLFGVFQRLHSSEEFEGTGVGLAIVQRIIERHQGRVWAEAAVGRGATFFFTLDSSPQPPINQP